MNRRLALSIGSGRAARGTASRLAQEEVTIGYQGLPYKSTGESNTGIQITDGVLLHAGVGVEAGYDTNVFYAPINQVGSVNLPGHAVRRDHQRDADGPGLAAADLRRPRGPAVPALRQLATSSSTVCATPGIPNAGLSLSLGGAQFGFGVADIFARVEDPPYASPSGARRSGHRRFSAPTTRPRSKGGGRRAAVASPRRCATRTWSTSTTTTGSTTATRTR